MFITGMENEFNNRHRRGDRETHLGRILMRLGLRDRAQAVVAAYESGLVTPRAP